MVDSKSGFEHKKFTTAINCTVKRVISMVIMYHRFKSILLVLFEILGNFLKNVQHAVPELCSISLVRRILLPQPLWLSRLIIKLTGTPVGDERKWVHEVKQSTWRGNWIVPNLENLEQTEITALNNDLVILYAHGGGFSVGNSKMYMETFQLIINHLRNEHHLRASMLSLEYSLSPENVWPKACHEAMDAYQYLIDTKGIDPKKIIFLGDSAGANLMATILLQIKSHVNIAEQQYLLPAGAGFLSPWIDLTINQASFASNGKHDIASQKQIAKYTPWYIPDYINLDEEERLSMIRNPLISPLYGDFNGTCPIFLAYGEKELLRTSTENFKSNLEKAGCNVTTLIGKNAVHNWMVMKAIAESKQIYEKDVKQLVNWMASISKSACINNNK